MIILDLSVQRFKKGKKSKKDYEFPQAVYAGNLKIDKKEKTIGAVLEGKRGKLPVRVHWDSDGKIFCVVPRAKEKIRFSLETTLRTGEPLHSFNVGGQNAKTGKFINWSANIVIHDRS